MASIRFSANLANSANATAKRPQKAVNHFATRTLRASSAAASGRKWRQKSIVVVVPSALSSAALDDQRGGEHHRDQQADQRRAGACDRMNVMKT